MSVKKPKALNWFEIAFRNKGAETGGRIAVVTFAGVIYFVLLAVLSDSSPELATDVVEATTLISYRWLTVDMVVLVYNVMWVWACAPVFWDFYDTYFDVVSSE